MIELPPPRRESRVSLEATLAKRRSVREFADRPLTPAELSQLLWAAQGVTNDEGDRTSPSAGATFPLETWVATADGLFHYDPARHALERTGDEDLRPALCREALGQQCVADAPAVFVLAAVAARTEKRYGPARTPRYVAMEAGHAAQNLLLQAVALGLGGVPVGAFEDARVGRVLGLPAGQRPLYLLPVGVPR